MPSIRQKGKISPSQWPAIFARYNAHEPLAKIARDYGCTAPAIRYIVKRVESRAKDSAEPVTLTKTKSGRTGVGKALAPTGEIKKAQTTGRVSVDPAVRERITSEIATFLCILDAAVVEPRREAMDHLRQAADRLMRAAARVRIDLDRVVGSSVD